MKTFMEILLILGVFAIATALWHPIVFPPVVIQSITNDMRGSTIHIWDEHRKAPIEMQIPDLKTLDIPPEVK